MKNNIEKTVIAQLDQMTSKVMKGKRKKLNTIEFEQRVKTLVGGFDAYINDGGYPTFASAIARCIDHKFITEMTTSKMNKRFSAIKENFWLEGKKKQSISTNKNFIVEMSDLFCDIYKLNKKQLTSQECLKIERIYRFLKNEEENRIKVLREERSLMLFYDLDTGNIEPEKFLSSSRGKSLLSRLGLTIENLNCEVIREPYDYWITPNAIFDEVSEILIVEGRATFKTFKKLLAAKSQWPFGNRPQMLILGGGKSILSSFEYTEVLFGLRKNMNISYFGDLDPEGYSIYYQLKERYEDYQIYLAADCYRFIQENVKQYAVKIHTDQVMNIRSFLLVSEELEKKVPGISIFLKDLWDKRLRIAQEAMNSLTISQQRKL